MDQFLVCIDRIDGSFEFFDHEQKSWHCLAESLELSSEQLLYEVQWLHSDSLLFAFGGSSNVGSRSPTNQTWSRNLDDVPLSSTWTASAPMNKNRSSFSSVVFRNTIYALGGKFKDYSGEHHILRSCERYDSRLNQWLTIDSMKTARKNASAAVYSSCIYIAGGVNEDGGTERSVEKYDPQSETWSKVAPMSTARSHFALTTFAGRLWAIGGMDGDKQALSSVESYDLESKEWKREYPLNRGRIGHSAIEFKGELYVVGGFKNFLKNAIGSYVSNPTTITESYISGKGWSEVGMLQKSHPFVTLLIAFNLHFKELISSYKQNSIILKNEPNGQKNASNSLNQADCLSPAISSLISLNESSCLLVCVNKYGLVEFYDHRHNSWHLSPVSLPLPKKQIVFQLALFGSVLYAFGGIDDHANPLNSMWSRSLSDPSSQWTARATMKQGRNVFSSVALNDTSIYALGGISRNFNGGFHALNSCERYDSRLNRWSAVAPMSSVRIDASAAVLGGCIVIAGGRDERREKLRSVERYHPQTDTWSELAPMTTARYDFALASYGGRLWAIGGVDDDGAPMANVESYDPVADTWREEAPLKEWRRLHEAIEFNGELYVVGGDRKYERTKVVEKYGLSTTGWVEDSKLLKICEDIQLLIVPPAYASFFTTG